MGKTHYNINFYDVELALIQREVDLLRDLVATQEELIIQLKTTRKPAKRWK